MWKVCSVTDSEIVFVLQITLRVRNIQYSVINLCQHPRIYVLLYMETTERNPKINLHVFVKLFHFLHNIILYS